MNLANLTLPRQFNPKSPLILWLDLNSAFASIEQLCNPHLRGRPIAVAPYTSPKGCIIAASIEAKRLGVKTGMLIQDGRRLCPDLIVLQSDPDKYLAVHSQLRQLLAQYAEDVRAESIDEFVLNMEGFPTREGGLLDVAREIKAHIRDRVGESLTVSIGLGPNHFLAKLAAGLDKPDGLREIHAANFREVYAGLRLMQLHGIKQNNCVRLNGQGIFTVMELYNASSQRLHAAFQSIEGEYWYLRLHGYEIDDVIFDRRSYGNSFAIPEAWSTPEELAPVLQKLIEKSARRMRHGGFMCRGVQVMVGYRDGGFWQQRMTSPLPLLDSRDLYKMAFRILCGSPYHKPVKALGESLFHLVERQFAQATFLEDLDKKNRLVGVLDSINDNWGEFTIMSALMLGTEMYAPDRISFGAIKELEERIVG